MTSATPAGRPEPFWAAPLCHPLPLGAALVMAVNDHWLKGGRLLPSVVTGKLSDFAGLFFFPLLVASALAGICALARCRWPRGAGAIIAVITGLAFALANLEPGFNSWLGSWFGQKQLDPTDLVALPSLLLSWFWLRRARRPLEEAMP